VFEHPVLLGFGVHPILSFCGALLKFGLTGGLEFVGHQTLAFYVLWLANDLTVVLAVGQQNDCFHNTVLGFVVLG